MKKLPIGISDFKKIIEDGYYFVDKSMFIAEVMETSAEVILLPRPRRFGKTINLSMLRYFFEKDYNNSANKPNEHLFYNLKIWSEDKYHLMSGKYPVIFLTFKDVKEKTWESTLNKLKNIIIEEIKRHEYVYSNLHLTDQNYFQKLLNLEGHISDYSIALSKLSFYLHEFYKQRVILLIDEYDAPIHASYKFGYYDDAINFIRNFLSGGMKDNPYLEKGVMTGILRVAKESIFSGLNNLAVFSILSKKFSDYFGITEIEVENCLKDYDLYKSFDNVKYWYNGYIFGGKIVYNPWSIMNYLAFSFDGFKPYWINTSDNEFIRDLVISGNFSRKDLELLLSRKKIEKAVLNDNISFRDIKRDIRTLHSLLVCSGYLKAKYTGIQGHHELWDLSIPNEEIFIFYEDIVSIWIQEIDRNGKIELLRSVIIDGNMEAFEDIMQDFVVNTLSYYDTGGDEPERVYHAFFLGLLLNMSEKYEVKSNREAGYGRYDVMLIPKDTQQIGYIFEFKKVMKQEDLKSAASSALNQIKDKKYYSELLFKNIKNIVFIGIAVQGKKMKLVSEYL
ncbi:MAG: AAA family ATPase [Desulfobacterales bacterium]|nr:AAA family ATPase [Desulfobacterales bacterium]